MRRILQILTIGASVPALMFVADCAEIGCRVPHVDPNFAGTWRGGGIELVVGHHLGTDGCDNPLSLIQTHGASQLPDIPWDRLTAAGKVERPSRAELDGHVWQEQDDQLIQLSSAKVIMAREDGTMRVSIQYTGIDAAPRSDEVDLDRQ